MPLREGSHDAGTGKRSASSSSLDLNAYVFPYPAPLTHNDVERSVHCSDDVHPFDKTASTVAVATPQSSTQSASPRSNPHAWAAVPPTAPAGAKTPVDLVPLHATLPPYLNVEALSYDAASPSRRGQLVRFTEASSNPAAQPGKSNNSNNSNDVNVAPCANGAAPLGTSGTTRNVHDDNLNYMADECVTSKAGSPVLEPYSVITKTGGVHISLMTQLLALLQRTYRQYMRHIISMLTEIISPLLFVVLVIILDVAFGKEKVNETVYVSPLRTAYPLEINSLDYETYLCYNDTRRPIDGLKSCVSLNTPYSCGGNESGIPVYGLCYPSYFRSIHSVAKQYVDSMLGAPIAIPSLDSIISHQWIAKKAGLASSSRSRTALAALSGVGIGVSANTRYDSISYSGKLYFAPAAKVPATLLAYIRNQSAMFHYVYGGTFETVTEAESFIKSSTATQGSLDSIWGLIVVTDITDGFDVQIRLHGAALPKMSPPVNVGYRSGFFSDSTDMYLASGYLSLQKVLYDYFYSTKLKNGDLVNVDSGAVLPYGTDNVYTIAAAFPSVESDNPYLFSFASSLVAFILTLSFLYPFSQMTKRLILEKELRIRESMCIMGLKRSSLWLNFFLVSFLEYLLICILLTVLLCAVVATRSSSFIIFLILLVYTLTLIPLSGLLSTFFSRARMAALMSPLIYFVLSMPIFAISSAGRSVVIGLSVLSPTGLAALLNNIFSAEAGRGFHASDFHSPYFAAKPYIVMIVIACDIVLYLLLMLYLDVVLPQDWGTRRHPLFFITEPLARRRRRRRAAKAAAAVKEQRPSTSSGGSGEPLKPARVPGKSCDDSLPNHEDTLLLPAKVPGSSGSFGTAPALLDTTASSLRSSAFDRTIGHDSVTGAAKGVGVRIDHLSKYFVRNGKRFAAVKDVSWSTYRGEIAVLLGPNGAGKSTTINMVTGMLASDGGDCFIEGHSVTDETAAARHEIGYCPQHNILWPDLTCREHLEFYGKIKGLRGADLEDAVVDILRAVDLEEKIDTIPTLMSGGQKRKLSVAIAFVGRNRVVLLDEPTAGMDPAARRHTWSLLRVMAEQRTIVLTTHYMDEADLLGGNVAIVSDGVLQCSGTTQFLRRYAGVGYTVRFDVSPIQVGADGEGERETKVAAVWSRLDQIIKRHLAGARLLLQTDAEVEYEMPQQAEAHIPRFLKEMESHDNRQLGIRGYALKAPTLEDVFMRVVENQVPTSASKQQQQQQQNSMGLADPPSERSAAATGGNAAATAATSTLTNDRSEERRRYTSASALSRDSGAAAGSHSNSNNNGGGDGGDVGDGAAMVAAPNHDGYAKGSQSANPSLSAVSPLHLRMSRASLRFYNNETRLNYGSDAEPSTASDKDDTVTATGSSNPFAAFSSFHMNPNGLSGCRFLCRASRAFGDADNNKNSAHGAESSNDGGDGEAAEHFAQSSSDPVAATCETPRMAGEAPETPNFNVAAAAAMTRQGNVSSDNASPMRTVAAKVDRTGPAVAAPLGMNAVRNEAFLFKHVTDYHLDQVWATRAITRRGSLWALQLRGMIYKRFFYALRDRRMLFFQIVCPVLCILLAMLLQLVKNSNSSTVHLSPKAFLAKTTMPVSSCTQYYGPVSGLSRVAAGTYQVEITDGNFASSTDLSYELLDTWYTHKYGRYVGLQCVDMTVQLYLTFAFGPSLGGRKVAMILYNTSSHNSLPVALHTAYAMAYYAGIGNASATFEMSVTSLPNTSELSKVPNAIAAILIGVIVLIPFTFLPANPVAWVVKEYETSARHLQTVSGLRYLVYWAGNFLFDFAAYVVTIVLVMIIFVIFQRSEYIGFATIGPTIVAFVLYGVCYCCMSYMVSFFFTEHTTAQLVVLGVSFLTGFLCVMLVFVLSLLNKTLSASNTLRWIFRLLPPFSIGEVILNLALLEQKKLTDASLTAWSMSITVWPDIYMAIETPVFAAVTLLWDHPSRRAVVARLLASLRSCCGCFHGKKAEKKSWTQQKGHRLDAAHEEIGAGNGTRTTRRSSTDIVAAVTPPAQRRAWIAQSSSHLHSSSNNNNNGDSSLNNNFGTSIIVNAGDYSRAISPTLRRRRASAADNSEQSTAENLPSGVLIRSVSPFHASQMEQQASQSLSQHGSPSPNRLPAVLYTPTTADVNVRREAAAAPHRHSTAGASRLQTSALAAAPSEMFYPPPRWYVSDGVCRQEEDSDVEEERNAVYKDERVYQVEGHLLARRPRTPVSAAKKLKKTGAKANDGNMVELPQEDHEPQSATAASQVQTGPDVIRVVDLRKVYDTPHKVAVSNLTFSVMHGEVFGFLGTNGAGKSTALSILTQEQQPTSGRAYVCGYDVMRDSSIAANYLGYCPQFDACLDLLTVSEHLRLYSLVRGVPIDCVEALVSSLLTICNLAEYSNVLSSDLSGGNRRKLSVAIALIGAPRVVCLDEPTSGLDPLARRLLWRALDRVSRKCSIILTTHHLEEVEALADCVGIMVDGGLRCLGDLPHLKHKYARNAYELTLCVSAAARKRATERRAKARQQAFAAAATVFGGCPGSGNAASPAVTSAGNAAAGSTSHMRNHSGSVTYAGIDRIDTSDDVFQFMFRHFPSALLVDNFNNERYVYMLPATRNVANTMLRLQNQQQRHGSLSFYGQSSVFSTSSSPRSNFNIPILRLSEVFEKLRAAQEDLGITEYSVSQVSLEQVFLRVCSTTEEIRKNCRLPLSLNDPAMSPPSATSASSPNPSRHLQTQLRQRRSHSIPADASSPSRQRLSMEALGGPTTRVTFAEYRRQRALMRMRAEAEFPHAKPSETQRTTEPDNEDSS